MLQAGSGADALETWKWHVPRVRLLLTDRVRDDHMTGLDHAARLRVENPALKGICISGHCRETMPRFPGLSGGGQFLQNPAGLDAGGRRVGFARRKTAMSKRQIQRDQVRCSRVQTFL